MIARTSESVKIKRKLCKCKCCFDANANVNLIVKNVILNVDVSAKIQANMCLKKVKFGILLHAVARIVNT